MEHLDGANPVGGQDDDLAADDDMPVDLPETKGSEVPEALKAERRKTNQLERELASRERQLQAVAQRKVRAAVKKRDEALAEVLNLRMEWLLER